MDSAACLRILTGHAIGEHDCPVKPCDHSHDHEHHEEEVSSSSPTAAAPRNDCAYDALVLAFRDALPDDNESSSAPPSAPPPSPAEWVQASPTPLPAPVAARSALEAQLKRGQVYKAFESVFVETVKANRLDLYPRLVEIATPVFQRYSTAVRNAIEMLDGGKEARDLLDRLQSLEKERLMLVAADHMERIRLLKTTESQAQFGAGVAEAHKRLKDHVVEIEELTSELRYAIADLEEEDQ